MHRGVALLIAFGLTASAFGQEPVAKSRVVSAGLFKNGLTVIKREVTIPRAGIYRLDIAPEPVHGTFWIEGNCKVDASVKMREVEISVDRLPPGDWHQDLAGKKVIVHLKSGKAGPLSGVVARIVPATEIAEGEVDARLQAPRFLMLQTPTGRIYIEPAEIAAVEADGLDENVKRRKPVLVLEVGKTEKEPLVYVSYLTHGMAWAPSYRLDISDPKTLAIEMAAVVRNELADVDSAEFSLISGYPSVEFANVLSPLSPHTTWARFFQEIANPGQSFGGGGGSPLMHQAVLTNNFIQPGRFKLGAEPAGEGVDLHSEPIGKRTLLKGEALSINVAQARAPYERVVEWTVGTSARAQTYGAGLVQDEMWDVLYFKNPFSFPMTTAPAMVVEHGKFNGQRTAYWTNAGEETRIRVTKALSLRVTSREEEDDTQKPIQVVVDGHAYTKVPLRGELRVSNHRKEPVKMHIRQQIRGAIQDIEANPRLTTQETSLTDVNRVHEALWTIELQPGLERKLGYHYSVLVRR